jgi:hypothetical protein
MNAKPGSRCPLLPQLPGKPISSAIICGFAVAIASLGLDHLLLDYSHLPPNAAIFLSDLLAGIIAGALFYQLMVLSIAERRGVAERLEIIAETNHHIRNALQIIKFNAHTGASERSIEEMQAAIDRIHWSLLELLPRVEPQFEAQDSARAPFLDPREGGKETERDIRGDTPH